MTSSIADLAALAQHFDSPDWNSNKALTVLYQHKHDRSAVLAITRAMRELSETDLMSTLMQFCHMIVVYDFPELEELLMERCHNSMNFALRMFFLLQAAMEDEIPELVYKTNRLWKQCELAAINAESTCPPRNRVCVENGSFKRKSLKDSVSASNSPSPHLGRASPGRASPYTTSLASVPAFNSADSLYSSTSLIPRSPAMSPVAARSLSKSQSDTPVQETEDSTVADLMEAANVNPELQSPTAERIAPTSTTTAQETVLDHILATTSISAPSAEHEPSSSSSSSSSQSDPSSSISSSSSSAIPPSLTASTDSNPSSSAFTPTSNTPALTSSIIQPSYASAVPTLSSIGSSSKAPSSEINPASSSSSSSSSHAPSSSSSHAPSSSTQEQTFGSSFFFKLRQLSGEGQTGHQRVYEYFYTELHMINSLFNISTALMSLSLDSTSKLKEVRGRALQLLLAQINTQLIQSDSDPIPGSSPSQIGALNALSAFMDESLTYGVEIPVVPGWVIVKIHPEDSFCLSSRNRVPYMMLIEVLAFDQETEISAVIANQPQHQTRAHPQPKDSDDSDAEEDWVVLSDEAPTDGILKKGFVELWSEKEKRIKDKSPFSKLPGWRLAGVIVKSGDDLRQEQLASQLIFKIHSWFQAEKLPLFLRPYVVLATSSTTGLIECIPDTCSIDSLKKRIPNFGSLTNYFICAYGHKTSHKFIVAQTNFIESLAAYSLVCYLLQIKDRHNGNILLDVEGHMIHIDFGFMLSISPGNLGFELAPFKLNQEMIELMGGVSSDMFKYFKTLLLSGLLEVRRHADELLLLVEVMALHSHMACFARGGAFVLAGLRERLALDKTEEECLVLVDTLVYNAMRSWTTQHYDSYQYYTNGIL